MPVGVLVWVPLLLLWWLLGVPLGKGEGEREMDGEREVAGEREEVAEKEGQFEGRAVGVEMGELESVLKKVTNPVGEGDKVASPDWVGEGVEYRLCVPTEGEACRLVPAVGLTWGAMVGVGVDAAVPEGMRWEGVRVTMEALGTPDTEEEEVKAGEGVPSGVSEGAALVVRDERGEKLGPGDCVVAALPVTLALPVATPSSGVGVVACPKDLVTRGERDREGEGVMLLDLAGEEEGGGDLDATLDAVGKAEEEALPVRDPKGVGENGRVGMEEAE